MAHIHKRIIRGLIRYSNVSYGPYKAIDQTLHSKGFLGMFSDITVKALGHDFRLHRIILLSNSYFAGMLSNSSWIEQSQDSIAIQFDVKYFY
ncbi:hypothetical protein BSLG_006463 [Batrachochytrium salamandrivorans]|nr:hypothetical protein BSLG_006463 [Batrachochytrium salamandrivorans]